MHPPFQRLVPLLQKVLQPPQLGFQNEVQSFRMKLNTTDREVFNDNLPPPPHPNEVEGHN